MNTVIAAIALLKGKLLTLVLAGKTIFVGWGVLAAVKVKLLLAVVGAKIIGIGAAILGGLAAIFTVPW